MHKYGAHGATDVTGFGILGHAKNLASVQKNAVDFVIQKLPIIAKMASVAQACGINFSLLQGYSAETSGMISVSTHVRLVLIIIIIIIIIIITQLVTQRMSVHTYIHYTFI